MPSTDVALAWLARWDRQQEYYMPDREERFEVIADVVAHAAPGPAPLVVDLGCGPGSLSVRLLDRLPGAQVVAVDADPLLLGLARSAYGDRDGLRLVETDLREPGWSSRLALPRAADAVVSTTALHWLTGPELARVYAEVAVLLADGGVFVDGDHQDVGDARLAAVERAVGLGRSTRVHAAAGAPEEDWAAWWDAVAGDPDLADLVSVRGARPLAHDVTHLPTLAEHADHLRDAGFATVGTVWQHGDDRVLVGLHGTADR